MTEETSQKYKDLDIWPMADVVQAMFDGQVEAVEVIRPALDAIAIASEAAASRLGQTGRLVYVGAGTSGRLAVLDGSELGPTFGWDFDRLVFCMAGGPTALIRSSEGAEDLSEDGQRAIADNNITANDVVFCVAASGRTPFTLGALREAKKRGALTIGISNNPDTPILSEADHAVLAQTGGEIIAGSTRMKAGTAQKIILNMLSTAIMTRLGRIYDGLMVDMVVSNAKLENRAINMVSTITGAAPDQARTALTKTDNDIKKAVLLCAGAPLDQTDAMLSNVNGNLRQALAQLPDAAS